MNINDVWDGDVLRERVFGEVNDEAQRGLAKFPKAIDYPDGTRAGGMNLVQREQAIASCDRAAADGRCTWAHVLAEEFWEAMCEEDVAKLRAELIQVCAVAANWVAHIDARPDLRLPNMTRTALAYAVWRTGAGARYSRLMQAETDEEVGACVLREKADWKAVTDVFALDTADRNAPENAAIVTEDFVRKCLAEWRAGR